MPDKDGKTQWWENLPGAPVDSVEEVVRHKIPLKAVHTCSAPDGNRSLGCPHYEDCTLPFKDTYPHNGGIEIIKQTSTGVKTRNEIMDCFGYMSLKKSTESEDREAIVDWIANEGDTVSVDETVYEAVPTPQGQPQQFAHVKKQVPKVVPAFVRLKDRKETQDAQRLIEKRAKFVHDEQMKKHARTLGVTEDDRRQAAAAASSDRGDAAEGADGQRGDQSAPGAKGRGGNARPQQPQA